MTAKIQPGELTQIVSPAAERRGDALSQRPISSFTPPELLS
jgi:hypothetical protein